MITPSHPKSGCREVECGAHAPEVELTYPAMETVLTTTTSTTISAVGSERAPKSSSSSSHCLEDGYVDAVFNMEVFNACQMSFWLSNFLFCFVLGALHKHVLCKVSTFHSEGFFKNCLSQNTVAAICK